ncbi:hypothetical protein [Kineosporia sp. NBRC 101731]|uniref:hypothetical protein n=1 Tax=Kineosporia sp. NBRC 101731 TaxID=3032199 RepID=UPI00255567EA|nr:hypothetical protein [Kineosporia sp. NBRC 101731]
MDTWVKVMIVGLVAGWLLQQLLEPGRAGHAIGIYERTGIAISAFAFLARETGTVITAIRSRRGSR